MVTIPITTAIVAIPMISIVAVVVSIVAAAIVVTGCVRIRNDAVMR